jgi:sugar O-acyltransferase (sialic acid O-acetyltransferase NeuD family)
LKDIIVFGAGGHAGVIIDMIEKSKTYSVYGLVDQFLPQNSSKYGYTVIGDETILLKIKREIYGGVVAIGDNWVRKKMVDKIRLLVPDFKFVPVIHPSAVISVHSKIGDGTVVMGGAIINGHSDIGNQCIINTNASIDHDCKIGDYVSIAPGATLGGNVKVGEAAAISLGAKVIHSLQIGEHTVIGAGATVLNDIESYKIAYGTPAKIIRSRTKGEPYL